MKGLTQWAAGIWKGLLWTGVMILLAGCAAVNEPVTPRLVPYVPDVSPADLAFASPGIAPVAVVDGNVPEIRRLRNGDKVGISLLGIPTAYSGNDEIDENGCVNLPLIGNQKIAGLTTAEAELARRASQVPSGRWRQRCRMGLERVTHWGWAGAWGTASGAGGPPGRPSAASLGGAGRVFSQPW